MNVIRYKHLFLGFSGVLVIVSIAALVLWGLRPGIDFTGGSFMEAEFSGARPAAEEIRAALEPLDIGTIILQPTGNAGVILRFRHVDEQTHQKILQTLQAMPGNDVDANVLASTGIAEKRFDAIGPTIGAELRTRALLAIVLTIAVIVLYIAWAFRRISKPVASWKYGAVTIVALVHDLAIPAGAFAAFGHFWGTEIDVLFITALLTILGFSVHDTIVVFDRIRENLRKLRKGESYAETVHRSINETFVRSVLTSCTVLLVLAIVFFLGGASTRDFTLALIIGITMGTYSSIFVASPLLVLWDDLTKKR